MKNIFERTVCDELIKRIEAIKPDTVPQWGTMNAGQMFAHCCVMYEMVFDGKDPVPGKVKRFFLRLLIKNWVTGSRPYPRNGRTAAAFKITDQKAFYDEQKRLIAYINQCESLGSEYFDGRDYPSFGKLTLKEWNGMFYKHLDHHLTQFGV